MCTLVNAWLLRSQQTQLLRGVEVIVSFVYMKILESRPHRYDFAMNLLTLGFLTKLKKSIATFVDAGDRVLDLGCGTGTLAHMLLENGATVVGIDSNKGMLNVARQNVPGGLYLHLDITQLDERFDEGSFDVIVSTLVFSELKAAERRFALRQVMRLLKPTGRMYLGDEVIPSNAFFRLSYYLVRIPMAFITWVVTQNTTQALSTDIMDELKAVGFQVTRLQASFFGMLNLFEAKR